ncbi:MAG: S8 family serine peptidase [Planctomycetaceae bacterium]|nr:S8 family serine peptidase [Planctomycetaceae bacterium]
MLPAVVPQADASPTGNPYAHHDAGDYYYFFSEKVSLRRRDSDILVKLAPGADAAALLDILTSRTGSAHRTDVGASLGLDTFVLSKDAADGSRAFSELKTVADSLPGVAWTAPVLVGEDGVSRFYLSGEIAVALHREVDPAKFFGEGFESWQRVFDNQYLAKVAGGGLRALQLANELALDSRVEWASPDFASDMRVATNDPLYNNQWNLNNTGQTGAKFDADADLQEAWNVTTGGQQIVVAVLDNGVQTNHPDLNIFVNSKEIPGNGVDDDQNGYVDDVNGWDFAGDDILNPAGTLPDNNPNPFTQHDNHGTAVAGIVGAVGGNGVGVTGAAQNVKILPVKIARDDNGQGGGFVNDALLAKAVYYAAGIVVDAAGVPTGANWRAADVLVNSWGGSAGVMLTAAFNYIQTHGRNGLGVASFNAAGNSASRTPQAPGSGYQITEIAVTPGQKQYFWSYKNNNDGITHGEDSAWIADITLPNGVHELLDVDNTLTGWSVSGNQSWTIPDDPTHAYGTARWVAKAGAIGGGQQSTLISPIINVAAASTLKFARYVSSQLGQDGLILFESTNGGTPVAIWSTSGDPMPLRPVSPPASLASTIAVGASTDWDYRAAYSQFGSTLDFVAPSSGGYAAITTTDRTSTAGYNTVSGTSGDYSSTFTGTSAATPLAAGIGALMLSKNPHLTPANIRSIMRSTADKIGGNNGQTAYVAGFNQYYGYGRVNAAAALAATPADVTGPRIGNVTIKGSTSTHAPFAFDGPDDATDFDGSGIQLQTVPVGGADSVSIQFAEHVSNVTAGSLTLRGLRAGATPALAALGGFVYDVTTQIATWKFSAPLAADQYLISLSDAVTDVAGNALDGEWINPFSTSTSNLLVSEFPSGNGTAGGSFRFVFTILPGDADLSDNYVTGSDYVLWASGFGGPGRSFNQGDFDGSGTTDSADLALWQANYGFNFHQLIYADFNHDGIVNGADLGIWSANFGSTGVTHAAGDADHDGDVDATDWIYLQRQIGVQLNWAA